MKQKLRILIPFLVILLLIAGCAPAVIDENNQGAVNESNPTSEGKEQELNSAPVLKKIAAKTVYSGEKLTFTLEASDSDNDAMTFTANYLPPGAELNTSTGTFIWTPALEGSYSTIFVVSDGKNISSQEVTISVLKKSSSSGNNQGDNNVINNHPPTFKETDDQVIDESEDLFFLVAAADSDQDTITYLAQNLPSGASLDKTKGLFAWSPSYEQAGQYTITFIASDGKDQTEQKVIVTVVNVNRAPTLSFGVSNNFELFLGQEHTLGYVSGNGQGALKITASDPDGDSVTVKELLLPVGVKKEGSNFIWEPMNKGSYTFSFIASDGSLESGHKKLTVDVDDPAVLCFTKTSPLVIDVNEKFTFDMFPAEDSCQFPLDVLAKSTTFSPVHDLPSGASINGKTFEIIASPSQHGDTYIVELLATTPSGYAINSMEIEVVD